MSDSYHHGDLKNALISAGMEILSKEGIGALSLRKAARRVGVSHTAPYAHFNDKAELIAAIATMGYAALYEKLAEAAALYPTSPFERLVEVAWAYVQFAVEYPDHFQVTFSGNVEHESDYPDYVAQSKKSLELVKELILDCQNHEILDQGNTEILAISIWAAIHGFITLLLGNQIPGQILDNWSLKTLLTEHIQNIIPRTKHMPLEGDTTPL